jgi:ubiquinone/menaquinone biosynthesis C-methylase UbiE
MESFRPVNNTPPTSLSGKIKFYGRMLLDLQILTIYRHIAKTIPAYQGNVLDVGCGQSPYKFLLNTSATKYFGVDIVDAEKFDYNNANITPFNGVDIPFEANMFDALICTEVLEHVQHYQKLIDEMHRVMKPGAAGIVTIPWSARYHYAPYDYFRYTPSSLKTMFEKFSEAKIIPRGSDVSNVANKLIVMWFRNLYCDTIGKFILLPFWIITLPILGVVVAMAHISLWFGLGSIDDPLGYTIIIKK